MIPTTPSRGSLQDAPLTAALSKKEIMKVRLFMLIVILSSLCHSSYGESIEPPPPTNESIKVSATLKVDPVREIRIGSFKAQFEKTTLGEILETVGIGSIQHAGEAGESQYWLCYSLPNQRIWLISTEMGGSGHKLIQVQAISTKSSRENAACPQIPARFKSISMKFGWLGTNQDDFIKALGRPSGKEDGRLMYHYAGKKPGVYDGQRIEWDVTSYVEVVMEKSKISSITASHVTSY
jgi:hypothetical protein